MPLPVLMILFAGPITLFEVMVAGFEWIDCFRGQYFIFHRQAPSVLCGVQSLSTLQFLKQEMVTSTVLLA